jgi:archaellum biogenesis ATPase FlaH
MLAETSVLEEIRYTKMRREDAYESIRELIDGIDALGHFMIVFAMNSSLLEDEAKGLKSYQALWMRIQNEISSDKVNRFADIINLNKVARQLEAAEPVVGHEVEPEAGHEVEPEAGHEVEPEAGHTDEYETGQTADHWIRQGREVTEHE